jgi:3-isopropylmalate dehydrogenase
MEPHGMNATLTLLPGDGIGPEVIAQGRLLLEAVAAKYGHRFSIEEAMIGGCAIDACGDPLPPATVMACQRADAVLLGAVGGPQWSDPNAPVRPEQGLLTLRATLGVFANLRPVKPHPAGAHKSPIKAELLQGVDLMFVRELTGGVYFGAKQKGADFAVDECRYTVDEIERVARRAADLARARRGKLTHVDKANVLETSRLWRSTVTRIMRDEYPEVQVEHLLVDAMAMYLLTRPADFDVILTENLFGDILTDEAAVLAGSMGLLPSASLGAGRVGLYEPIHGSAPDIAGKGIANPYATLLSVALLLRHSLDLEVEAAAVEAAVAQALDDGVLTRDLTAINAVSTETAGAAVIARLPTTVSQAA